MTEGSLIITILVKIFYALEYDPYLPSFWRLERAQRVQKNNSPCRLPSKYDRGLLDTSLTQQV